MTRYRGVEQVRFVELLQEPTYRDWVKKRPTLEGPSVSPPWRVWIQHHQYGRWRRKEFENWVDAWNFMVRYMKQNHPWDAALQCKRYSYLPPSRMVKIRLKVPQQKLVTIDGEPMVKTMTHDVRKIPIRMPPGHIWCPYCRRPTVFAYFAVHHSFPKGALFRPEERRCTICGVTEFTAIGR